jgi:hypothetical protein
MFMSLLQHIQEAVSNDEKYEFFIERTNNHIRLVQEAAEKIVSAYPELGALVFQVDSHDASKFEDPELTPYIELTWKKKLEKEEEDYKTDDRAIHDATLHHIKNNRHHPEFHLEDKSKANLDSTNRDKSISVVDASNMSDTDVAEMVADWQAMSEELGTNTAREWYDKVKDVRWHFSDHQNELIDKLLKVFE